MYIFTIALQKKISQAVKLQVWIMAPLRPIIYKIYVHPFER